MSGTLEERASQPIGYKFPADALTASDMVKMRLLEEQTGRPVQQLLHEAIIMFFNAMHDRGFPEQASSPSS